MAWVVNVICFAALWASGPGAAIASELPPILDDRDRGTRVEPRPDAIDPASLHEVADPTAEDPGDPVDPIDVAAERYWTLLSAHTRWVTIPSFLFGVFFDSHPPYNNLSAGLGLELGSRDDTLWVIELDWTPLIPRAGNWLPAGDPPDSANYAESGLHMISVDVSYRKYASFSQNFHWYAGAGLGVAVLAGNIRLAEVLPTCEEPVASCAHWRSATDENADLPTRILPVIHLTTGFQLDFGDSAMVRIEAGFRNVLYAGLTVGMAL